MIAHKLRYTVSNVINFSHLEQHGQVVHQHPITHVIIPGEDRQAALGLEDVGGWRVIDQNRVFHVPPQHRHILDKNSIHKSAVLTEQSRCAEALRVHLVHEWVGVLGNRSRIDDHFEDFGDLLQKVVDTWPFQHVDVAGAAFHLHWDHVVGILHEVELRVHQCFIQIQNKSLAAATMLWLRAQ